MITHMVLLAVPRGRREAGRGPRVRGVRGLEVEDPGAPLVLRGRVQLARGDVEGLHHGFCMTFRDAAARDVYFPHPEHERVKKLVFALLDGGLDGVVAFDYAS